MKYNDDYKVYRIKYFNVWFYLFAETGIAHFPFYVLKEIC